MAFEHLTYTKSWENSEDFPTYEPDEGKVRADLQLLHDEARDGVNRLIDALNSASAAAQIPIAQVEGMEARTVQAAIEEVFAAVVDAASGTIINGSVTKEKLETALLKRIYGGRVWLSLNAPTAKDDPDADFPIGQMWLNPACAVRNLACETWDISGGTVEAKGDGWIFTSGDSQDFLTAAQELEQCGSAGQRMFVKLQLGQQSNQLNALRLSLNGLEQEIEEDGWFETELDQGGGLEIQLNAEWPDVSEGRIVEVTSLVVVNVDEIESAIDDCEPCSDWPAALERLGSFSEAELPMRLWLQAAAGSWQQISQSVLPVSRGGTGLDHVQAGAMLYGTGGEALAVLPVVENGILQWSGGTPQLVEPQTFAKNNRYPLISIGRYTGSCSSEDRVVELEIEAAPQFLIIYPADGSCDTVLVANGGKSSRTFSLRGDALLYYEAWVALSGKKLTFSNARYGNYADQMLSQHMNAEGVQYNWIAVCGGEIGQGSEAEEGETA